MSTINDVAKRAGVNISTVSRLLSGKLRVETETENRIMEAVRELNYQPNLLAKGLKEGKTDTIALIIPNIQNGIFSAVARGVQDMAMRNGYHLILCNTDGDIEVEKKHITMLRKRLVDGIIFCTATQNSYHIQELKEDGFPIVLLLRHMGNVADAVVADNFNGAYQATRYLIERGCRKIAYLGGDHSISLYLERHQGYKKCLEIHGIPFDPSLVASTGKTNFKDGYNAMMELLTAGHKIDGVFAPSDNEAIGAIKAIQSQGLRVPEDVKVMGFIDLDFAEFTTPTLSAMRQPLYQMGECSMELLLERIRIGSSEPVVRRVFPLELVERGSTTHSAEHSGGAAL